MIAGRLHRINLLALFLMMVSNQLWSQDLTAAKQENQNFVDLVESGNDSAIYVGYQLVRKYKSDETYKPLLSRVYLSMGNYYKSRGDLSKAIEFYQLTEDIAIEFKDTVFMAYAKGSMGFVYTRTQRHHLALEVYKKNLMLWEQRNDPTWIPTACHNIVTCLNALNQLDSIDYYIDHGLTVADSFDIVRDKAELEYDKAYHLYRTNPDSSINEIKYWLTKSKETAQLNKDLAQIDQVNLLLAEVSIKANEVAYADSLCQKVFDRLDKLTISRPLYLKSCECLVNTRQMMGRKEAAMRMMWHYVNINDSLSALAKVEELNKIELNHGIYRETVKDSLDYAYSQNEAKMQLEAEKEKHQILTWIGVLAGIIIVSLAVYLYRNYRASKSALIELEEVTQEIKDSINYAFRIQNAFLPKPELLNEWFDDAFVLYLPKDVVAGDFYWFEEVGDWILVASADCTGHGVPGAMVSVVCHSALQKALVQCGPEDPAKILDKASDLVERRFMLEKTPMKDGMDIGLCCFNKSTRELYFSGAHNPMWLVKDGAISEFKGDKRPIGFHENKTPFTKHEIKLAKGDVFYLSSDGYADQFGGERGKKFKSKALKQLILSQSKNSMNQQKAMLETSFNDWMKGYEQLDDVCVIGIRV